MVTAHWNGQQIAASDKTIYIEGNHYFPPEAVDMSFLEETDMHTTCHWKGEASYFNVIVDGKTNPNAAFRYRTPKESSIEIVKGDYTDWIAFWQGVETHA